MKDKKKKGPAASEQTGPKHKAKAKHILKDRIKELDSQEARLLLSFLETYPPGDATLTACEMTWTFIKWLKEKRFYIIQEEAVFCVPFHRLVNLENLK